MHPGCWKGLTLPLYQGKNVGSDERCKLRFRPKQRQELPISAGFMGDLMLFTTEEGQLLTEAGKDDLRADTGMILYESGTDFRDKDSVRNSEIRAESSEELGTPLKPKAYHHHMCSSCKEQFRMSGCDRKRATESDNVHRQGLQVCTPSRLAAEQDLMCNSCCKRQLGFVAKLETLQSGDEQKYYKS